MSLVEILIVIAILSLSIIPVFHFFRGQRLQSSQAGSMLATHSHALEVLERQVSRLHGSRFRLKARVEGPEEREMDWGKGKVAVEERVEIRPSSYVTGLWRIDVHLAWRRPGGEGERRRELHLSRLVSDPSIGWKLPKRPAHE